MDVFLAAARDGDFERLMTVLDPDIVLPADGGALAGASRVVRGAQAVAGQAATFSRLGLSNQVVLATGTITEIEVVGNPARLGDLDVSIVD